MPVKVCSLLIPWLVVGKFWSNCEMGFGFNLKGKGSLVLLCFYRSNFCAFELMVNYSHLL